MLTFIKNGQEKLIDENSGLIGKLEAMGWERQVVQMPSVPKESKEAKKEEKVNHDKSGKSSN